jgi:hypothetical protein
MPRIDVNVPKVIVGAGECFTSLRRWALAGATQHPTGAIGGWRDADNGSISNEYPEVTGYLLTYAASISADARVARRALRWLGGRVRAGNLAARDVEGPTIYNFDLAMMATGLMRAGAVLASREDVAAGRLLAEHLRQQVETFGFLPTLDAAGGPCQRPPAWSTSGRAHLAKVVQALLIADRHGAPGMVDAAAALIAQATTVTGPETAVTWLHPLLYAAEGFWIWGTAQRDGGALAMACDLVDRAWAEQLPNGGFPAVTGGSMPSYEQGDVLAQVVRMSVATDVFPRRFEDAVRRLCEISAPCREGSAVIYHPDSGARHENMWSTLFAVQALESIVANRRLRWTALV